MSRVAVCRTTEIWDRHVDSDGCLVLLCRSPWNVTHSFQRKVLGSRVLISVVGPQAQASCVTLHLVTRIIPDVLQLVRFWTFSNNMFILRQDFKHRHPWLTHVQPPSHSHDGPDGASAWKKLSRSSHEPLSICLNTARGSCKLPLASRRLSVSLSSSSQARHLLVALMAGASSQLATPRNSKHRWTAAPLSL